jgi:diguanylate cyclase (GGDEF)-like protein
MTIAKPRQPDDRLPGDDSAGGAVDPATHFAVFDHLDDPIAVVRESHEGPRVVFTNAAYRRSFDDWFSDDLACASVRSVLEVRSGAAAPESCISVEAGGAVHEFTAWPAGAGMIVARGLDVSERVALAARVAYDAHHDKVTGLLDGDGLVARIDAALSRRELLGAGGAVVIVDIDQYRAVSDGLGPDASAELLRAIGERLERTLRFGDCVARISGDEFTVFCADVADASEATQVAHRLLATFGEPVDLEVGEVFVSATVGIAELRADDDTAARVLRDAHAALSQAKLAGPGSIEVFDERIRADVVQRIEIEKELHRALREGHFRVFYQPLVRFAGAEVVGFEALVRWDHPERGIVGPTEFIPVAEATGLIVPIGEWVLREACAQASRWIESAPPWSEPLVVSVNLSARQLGHPAVVSTVASAVADARIDPSALVIEVTESTLMADPDLATTILHALRSIGVRIAIDDFGTGHSSLGYLKHLPVDCLKIDRAFVMGLGENSSADADDRAIVGAVVAMGHALGLTVTAEGVETVEQLDALAELGCDVAQGFYFARPQPGEVASALVHRRISWRTGARDAVA